MESEKCIVSDCGNTLEQPPSNLYMRRRRSKVMIALGAIAILTTGFAGGAGVSMMCGNDLGQGLQSFTSSLSPTSPDSPLHNLYNRATGGITSEKPDSDHTVVAVQPASKPIKYYGPTVSLEEALLKKLIEGEDSIEKRDASEPFYSRIFGRETLSKRDVWQPAPGLNWTYQLSSVPTLQQIQTGPKYQVWDIDLFDTPASTIQAIHNAGSKVICYFSAGTYENWRPDVAKFKAADIGSPMGDWPGENWVNTRSKTLRSVMAARLDLAQSKGCDGVDPDNMDAYNHLTGFSLQQSDAVSYIKYLAAQASSRGLAIGLKNTGDIIPKVVNNVQYSVEEACYEYNECGIYAPFTNAKKPVFHVEYPKGYGVVNTNSVSKSTMTSVCACIPTYGFSPIVKNNNLDTWQQQC